MKALLFILALGTSAAAADIQWQSSQYNVDVDGEPFIILKQNNGSDKITKPDGTPIDGLEQPELVCLLYSLWYGVATSTCERTGMTTTGVCGEALKPKVQACKALAK